MSDNTLPVNIVEQEVFSESDNLVGDAMNDPTVEVKGDVTPVESADEADAQEDTDGDVAWMRKELERTRKEAAEYRVKARELREKLEGSKSADEVKALMDELEARAAKAERDALVSRLGKTLPEPLLEYVKGNTEDEIAASVKLLSENLAVRRSAEGAGGLNPKTPADSHKDLTPTERAMRIPLY